MKGDVEMDGIYVTLDEAAELEEIKYDTMQKRVRRTPDKFNIVMEQQESGGREVVMVAVSSLSKKARTAWKEREKLKAVAEVPDQDTGEKPEVPWYVNEDIDWFIENHRDKWYRAMELGNIVREFMDYEGRDKVGFARDFAKERLGKNMRTLYRYVDDYMEAQAWADRLHREDGGNYEFFKVLCLCRKPKDAGTFPSFKPEVRQAIKNIWFNREFAQNQGTKQMLYDKLEEVKSANKWEKIPSYSSVTRYIDYLMQDEHMKNAWYLASRGEREYRNKVMVKGERCTSDLKVMELVMGDEHTFDCWVSYTHPNGKVTAIRPTLVAWIDIRSRMVMGDVICHHANSEILKKSVLKMLYQDAGSAPQSIYVDNGKDYTSEEMTGYKRNDRKRMEFDDATKGFYKSIGIEDYHRALPYYAWTKGNVERLFGTVCSKFSKWITSYTGTLTGSRTFAKVQKDVDGMLERGELMTMEEFFEKWTYWLHNIYMLRPHSGLKKQGEEYTTPKGCFENAEKYEKPLPPKSYATTLMMKSERCYVRNVGIKMQGLTYMSDDLCDYIHEYVDVKYDPHDMKTVYIFRNEKQVCEAYAQELLTFASENGVEQKALKEHLRRQKMQIRKDRERLEEANVSFTELNDQYTGFNEVTGGIDLMIGKKPAGKSAKVVTMPEDNTYRNGFRGKSAEEPQEESDYINRKAEEALRALRAL